MRLNKRLLYKSKLPEYHIDGKRVKNLTISDHNWHRVIIIEKTKNLTIGYIVRK
jgi:hypothetical protein